MLPLQLRRHPQRQKELTPVAILALIRHPQQPSPVELEPAVELILERFAVVDGADAARAGSCGIAALDNEAGDEAVEDGVGVVAVEAVLEEVASCEGGLLAEEFELEVARGCL